MYKTSDQVKKHVREKAPVDVVCENRRGAFEWFVYPAGERRCWLQVFPDEKHALLWCKHHGLQVINKRAWSPGPIKIVFVASDLDSFGSAIDADAWLNDNWYYLYNDMIFKDGGGYDPPRPEDSVGWVNFCEYTKDAFVHFKDGSINLVRHPDILSLSDGDSVLLFRDDGGYEHRTVKYGSWVLGHGKRVVGLHGLVGGWDADRIYVVNHD